MANGTGGLLAVFFAATYPQRVSSLVLDGCYARRLRGPDYLFGVPKEVLDQAVAGVGEDVRWRRTEALRVIAPNAVLDPEFVAQYQRYFRSIVSPATLRAFAEMFVFCDVGPALPAVQARTLVLYRSDDHYAREPHAVYLAEQIPGAKLVELPGEDNLIVVGDSHADLDEVEEFLTGTRHVPVTDRVLATVLFTARALRRP